MKKDIVTINPLTGEPVKFKHINLEPRTGLWVPSKKFLQELEITKAKLETKPRKADLMREQDHSIGAL